MILPGVHLRRREENLDEIAAVIDRLGKPVGLQGVLEDLNHQATQTKASGRAPSYAFGWEADDNLDQRWWPQGITTSADANDTGAVHDRRLLITSWYSKGAEPGVPGPNEGSRITIVDLETLKYRHVLLVTATTDMFGRPAVAPLRVHAGGIVWFGDYLYVAGTKRGLFTAHLDDLMHIESDSDTFGYRYVLPVRYVYDAFADDGHELLRYSFLSVDRSTSPPELVAGEYGVLDMSTRLARFEFEDDGLLRADEDGCARPVFIDDGGVGHMQGACVVGGRYYVTSSRGRWRLGNMYSGTPGKLRRFRFALPPGPEDISYWPETDQLWSLTEYPSRRVVFAMNRKQFG
ncbi:MAG: hypothetical protein V9E81_12825 [Marmoricola sp.]